MVEVVMLHDVMGTADPIPGPYACAVHTAVLDRYLSEHRDWSSWGGDELALWLNQGCPPQKRSAYVITFDDAYLSFRQHALPILKQYEAKAIVFVATSCADGWVPVEPRLWRALQPGCNLSSTPWRGLPVNTNAECVNAYHHIRSELKMLHPRRSEELLGGFLDQQTGGSGAAYMTWGDIMAVKDEPLVEFGSHTLDHVHLPSVGVREVRRQLVQSRRELQLRLRLPVRWHAYPYGAVSPSVLLQAWAAGYEGAFLASPGARRWLGPMARFAIPRTELHDS